MHSDELSGSLLRWRGAGSEVDWGKPHAASNARTRASNSSFGTMDRLFTRVL